MHKFLFLLAIITSISFSVKAQELDKNSWVDLGFGPGYLFDSSNLIGGGLAGLTFKKGPHLLSGRLATVFADSDDGYFDAGILYGLNLKGTNKEVSYTLQAGVGYLSEKVGDSNRPSDEKYRGVGIPIQAGIRKVLSKNHSAGGVLYTILNENENFVLVLFTIHLGVFRE